MMNPPSCFRFASNHMHFLICLRCNKKSAGILCSNPAYEFDHECTNSNYDLPESSSVQLHQDNNVVHLFSSNYLSDNGQTNANGIK